MTSFTGSMSLEWPAFFGEFCAAFAFLNIDLTSIFALGCVADTDYFGKVLITFLLPTIVYPTIVLSAYICINCLHLDVETVKTKHWVAGLFFSFLIYPNCCQSFLSMFLCHDVEGTHYLMADYSLECFDDKWTSYAIVAILGIVLYCFGIPATNYILLFQNKHKLFVDDKFIARYGFMYARYEEEYFYWVSLCIFV